MSLSLFYNHLTVLDYAFITDDLAVQGGSFIVDVELVGKTGNEGVIFDFSLAKKTIKQLIDKFCDHRLLVPQKNNLLQIMIEKGYGKLSCGDLFYHAPIEAFCLLPTERINATSISIYLSQLVMPEMPTEVEQIHFILRDETAEVGELFFSYTHGLKQHYGNCQRLLHGHRSRLQIFEHGQRCRELESWLIEEVFHHRIHFAFAQNVQETSALVSYKASQGDFMLNLPENELHIVPVETTVENLAVYFKELCCQKVGHAAVEVWAYEGVGKGAKSS